MRTVFVLGLCASYLLVAVGCASSKQQCVCSPETPTPATPGTSPTAAADLQRGNNTDQTCSQVVEPTRSQATVRRASAQAATNFGADLPSPEAVPSAPGQSPGGSGTRATHPIDLPTALRLADEGNYQIALAREQVSQAWAKANYAQTQWLPSLRAGVNYNKHEGRIQDIEGHVFDVSRANLYTGLGAGTPAAGSPAAPGLYANFHLADALFNPLAAKQAAGARQSAAVATTNDLLWRVSLYYVELLRAAEDLAISQQARTDAQQLADLTGAYAQSGQGLRSDADRAATELSIRRNDVLRSQEAVQVASARLAQILRLDPTVFLDPIDLAIAPLDLVPADAPVGELVAEGLSSRPELAESRFLVGQAVQKMRREQYACLVPSIIVGVSVGDFGGGTGDTLDNFGQRLDADAIAYWELRNLGYGDRAARDETRSLVRQATVNQMAAIDQVAREVAEAYTQVTFRRQQITIAKQAVESAESAHSRNLERIQELQGLPIEVLQSNQALAQARREYLRAVTDYNSAQFSLYRALGWPNRIPETATAERVVPPPG